MNVIGTTENKSSLIVKNKVSRGFYILLIKQINLHGSRISLMFEIASGKTDLLAHAR